MATRGRDLAFTHVPRFLECWPSFHFILQSVKSWFGADPEPPKLGVWWQAAASSQPSELVSDSWERPALPEGWPRLAQGSSRENDVFAVCYYGECPRPSRRQNVNATEHFHAAALCTEACQEALEESVRLPSTTKPPPSTAAASSPALPFIYLPAVCHLLISPVAPVWFHPLFLTHSQTLTASHTCTQRQVAPQSFSAPKHKLQAQILVLFFLFLDAVCRLVQSPSWIHSYSHA